MESSENKRLRELRGARQFGYNFGYFGMYLGNMLISVFVFQFYVYTVNLSSVLVSIGVFFQLFLGALFSIVIGVIIDNKKPKKLGKRRPFLLYGLPIWAITLVLIFTPPWYCPKNNAFYLPVTLYLLILLIVNSIASGSILVAHASILPEQSQTLKNRSNVAASGAFLTIIASVLVMLFPLIIQSVLEDPENVKWWEPSGETLILFMPVVALLFAITAAIGIASAFFSVDESFYKSIGSVVVEKKSLKKTFQQMKIPLNDEKYRDFLMVSFNTQFSSKVIGIVLMPFLIYVIIFYGASFFIYILVAIVCKVGWFFFWRKKQQKSDLVRSYHLCLVASIIASAFELLFLIQIVSFEIRIALFVVTYGTVLGGIYAAGLFNTPLACALVDESAGRINQDKKEKAVSEISGSYFGINQFMLSFGQAIASIFVGLFLIGPNEEDRVVLTMLMASAGLFYLIALIYLFKMRKK